MTLTGRGQPGPAGVDLETAWSGSFSRAEVEAVRLRVEVPVRNWLVGWPLRSAARPRGPKKSGQQPSHVPANAGPGAVNFRLVVGDFHRGRRLRLLGAVAGYCLQARADALAAGGFLRRVVLG